MSFPACRTFSQHTTQLSNETQRVPWSSAELAAPDSLLLYEPDELFSLLIGLNLASGKQMMHMRRQCHKTTSRLPPISPLPDKNLAEWRAKFLTLLHFLQLVCKT